MDNIEIINLWKSNDKKLAQNLVLNRKIAEEITRYKIKSALSSMSLVKLFAIAAGIAWVVFLDIILVNLTIYALGSVSIFFLISAGSQAVLTKLAIGIYIYQLALIHQTDISESITETQERLTKLKASTMLVVRVLFLQLPVWSTFYWNRSMLQNGNILLFVLQALLTISFTYLAIWLFRNISLENKDKKWFRLIFSGQEWTPIIKSMELLKEIEEFKKDQES
jgi:hypothetical protein